MIDNFNVQTTALKGEDVKALERVEDIVDKAVTSGDPTSAFSFGSQWIAEGIARGKMLAKMLYLLEERWHLFTAAGINDDLPTMAFIHMGIKPQTTRRYIDMWRNVMENPRISRTDKNRLMGRPISDLLLITKGMASEDLTDDDIHDIAYAADTHKIKEIVRNRMGTVGKANHAVLLYIQMQDSSDSPAGTVYAKRGRKKEVLFVVNPDLSELGLKAMERIINRAGIQEIYYGGQM